MCFPFGSDSKESTCNAGDPSSIPGSWRSSREGNGYPLQYFCLENFVDRGDWRYSPWSLKSQTWLNYFTTTTTTTHVHTHIYNRHTHTYTLLCLFWASLVLSGKESSCQCKRCRFNPWVRNIPLEKEMESHSGNFCGKSHGQRNLASYSPQGHKSWPWLSNHTITIKY